MPKTNPPVCQAMCLSIVNPLETDGGFGCHDRCCCMESGCHMCNDKDRNIQIWCLRVGTSGFKLVTGMPCQEETFCRSQCCCCFGGWQAKCEPACKSCCLVMDCGKCGLKIHPGR